MNKNRKHSVWVDNDSKTDIDQYFTISSSLTTSERLLLLLIIECMMTLVVAGFLNIWYALTQLFTVFTCLL